VSERYAVTAADHLARARAAMAEGFCPMSAIPGVSPHRLVPTTLTDGAPAGWCPSCAVAWHWSRGLGYMTFTGPASPNRQAIIPEGCR
jgi:hypothetical protein